MANANLSDLITPSEAAALRGVSRQAIDDLMRRGKLQTWEIGGRVFVSRKAVLAYRPAAGGRPRKAAGGRKKKAGETRARKVKQPPAKRD
jgi:excisionase family DNA binding protein